MPNFDPLILGDLNNASSPTRLSTMGSAGGDNFAALIVRKSGLPAGDAALIAISNNDRKVGVIGRGARVGVGVMGTAQPLGPNLISSDTGVFDDSFSTGVFGRGQGGLVKESDGSLVAAGTGVAGVCESGVGVHGTATSGLGVVGQSVGGVGVAGKSSGAAGVSGNSQTAQGVFGTSVASAGVVGLSTSGTGVRGRTVSGIGVIGESQQSMGVYGSANGQPGVRGDSGTNHGVMGMSTSGTGVMGWSTQGSSGVYGYSDKKVGVWAHAVSGIGLYADSGTHIGVLGWQTANTEPNGAGVFGRGETGFGVVASSNSGIALYAKAINNLAARFDGDVQVHGAFSVVGGPKSAVVRHRDGTHRQLYCVESPESWFEDFGETRLVKGVAKVKLDPDFAALIDTGKYQVFLTSYDPVQLFVHKRSREGFEIRAIPGPDGKTPKSARCSYRLVSRRKDISAPRLAKVKLSKPVKHPQLPKLSALKMPDAMKRSDTAPSIAASPELPPAPQVPEVRAPEIPLPDGEE